MLLVDDDQPERGDRREDGRARTDDDAGLAGGDSLALVAPLGVREGGVQHGDALAEAGGEASDRLGRERDLRHEHDRAAPTLERRGAGAEVDLGLAAARRPVQEDVPAAGVERGDDPLDGVDLGVGQPLGLRLAGKRVARRGRPPLAATGPLVRRHERERAGGRRPVVLGEPERELDERRRNLVDDRAGGGDLHPGRRLDADVDDDAAQLPPRRARPRRPTPAPPHRRPRT